MPVQCLQIDRKLVKQTAATPLPNTPPVPANTFPTYPPPLLTFLQIDRKLVKQTVMTSVYGVTFIGARAQIGNRLKERGFEDSQLLYKVSCYSAKVWAVSWWGACG